MKLIQTVMIEIPAYALGFLSETLVLVAGGGGNANSGIFNQFRIYLITKERLLELEMVYTLPLKDAPMSLVIDPLNKTIIAGINELNTTSMNEKNRHLHLFQYVQEKKTIIILKSLSIFPLLNNNNCDDYQRITRFNHSRTLLAIASANGYFALLKYPSLKLMNSITLVKPMVMDLDFSLDDSKMVYVSLSKLYTFIFSIKQVFVQSLKEGTFRAVRWIDKNTLISVIHRQGKPPLLQRWKGDFTIEKNLYSEKTIWIQTNSCSLHKKSHAVTCIDIAYAGQWMVIACADLSITIVNIHTLKILQRKTKIHTFPITALTINSKETQILTVSADARLQVIDVFNKKKFSSFILLLFFAAIAAILATIPIIHPAFYQKLVE